MIHTKTLSTNYNNFDGFPNEIICLILDFCEPTYQLVKINKDFENYLLNQKRFVHLLIKEINSLIRFSELFPKDYFDVRFRYLVDFFKPDSIRASYSHQFEWLNKIINTKNLELFQWFLKSPRLNDDILICAETKQSVASLDNVEFFEALYDWKQPPYFRKFHRRSSDYEPSIKVWLRLAVEKSSLKILDYILDILDFPMNRYEIQDNFSFACRKQNEDVIAFMLSKVKLSTTFINFVIIEYCIKLGIENIFPLLFDSKDFESEVIFKIVKTALQWKRLSIVEHIYQRYGPIDIIIKQTVKFCQLELLGTLIQKGLSPSWNGNWLIQKCSQRGLTDFVRYLIQFDQINVSANNNFAWRKSKPKMFDDIVTMLENHHSFVHSSLFLDSLDVIC